MIDDRNLCKTVGELHFTCDVFVSCVMPFPNVHSRAQSDLDAVVRRRSRPPAQYLHKAWGQPSRVRKTRVSCGLSKMGSWIESDGRFI